MVYLPVAGQIFANSYRVRLKEFPKKYKMIFIISLVFLFMNFFAVVFNKELYKVIQNPKKHFAYKMYIVKELSTKLKKMDINCIYSNENISNRLKFYGISKCHKYLLKELDIKNNLKSDVTISYKDVVVYKANVTKTNKE